jgi:hypothetical protein
MRVVVHFELQKARSMALDRLSNLSFLTVELHTPHNAVVLKVEGLLRISN